MAEATEARGPLSHLRVLDITVFAQGAIAGQLLREFGADVIKVERPGAGDPGRRLSQVAPGISAFFEPHNRGKRGVVIDLQSAAGREVFLRLAEGTDVLVHNLSVGAMERLGLGYEDVAKVNPSIIYAHGTGLGLRGPDASQGVVDLIGQPRGGLAAVTGTDGPVPAGAIISDQLGGMYLLAGILAAVVHRERTGEGQFVESSMLGALIRAQGWEVSKHLFSGEPSRRGGTGHPLLGRLYGVYETAAGYMAITNVGDDAWAGFCEATGAEDLAGDLRFATAEARQNNGDDLVNAVRDVLRRCEARPLARKLQALGIRCSAVQDYSDIAKDEQALANGYVLEVSHPALGDVTVPGNPVFMGKTPVEIPVAAPLPGQHTDEVLAELGLEPDAIAGLHERGAVE